MFPAKTFLPDWFGALIRRLQYLVFEVDVEVAEVVVNGATFVWAAVFFTAVFTGATCGPYLYLFALVNRTAWAVIALSIAILHFAGILKSNRLVRRRMLLVSSSFFAVTSVLVSLAAPCSVEWGFNGIFLACSAWAYWRLGRSQ